MSFKRYYLKEQGQNKSIDSSSYVFDIASSQKMFDNLTIESVLLYLTVSRFGKDWKGLSHSHSFSEFFCISKGRGQFVIANDTIDVEKNDIIIINPNIDHSEISSSQDPMEYIVLGMENIVYESNDHNYYHIHNSVYNSDMCFYFRSLVAELEKKQDYQAILCQNIMYNLLIMVYRAIKIDFSIIPSGVISKECLLAKTYIERYFHDDLTLDDIAEYVHLNKYYLTRTFTKAFGISPINYLISKRIEECQNLLANTDMSLSMISEAVGFSSQSYFSQRFKKETGLSPQEYRKQYS